ncbi:MAG: methylenetetrahydrofolate reductase [Thermoanaerobaculia bacterium]
MKVLEHLERADGQLISFEIIPPLRGGSFEKLRSLIEELIALEPPFIDITSHAAQIMYDETPQGIVRRIKRKRPGTLGVCALIQNKYNVDAVPHVICHGFTREETEDFLIELHYLGIDNVLAIRGDDSGFQKPLQFGRTANRYAEDLVRQISELNRGKYLEEELLDAQSLDFCVGIAGYPEKHFEAPNMETDLRFTRTKVEAGGDYIVTQMFFDNRHYFRYVERCREIGVEVPIIPGLKILTSHKQVTSLPRTFHCEVPAALADEVLAADPDRAADIGVEWAVEQSRELLEAGVPALHFYVMQSAHAVSEVVRRLDPVRATLRSA